ncbi:MAG: 50S ribosomal protein L4 [Candidatus Moraniibacteriota bacterium]
MSKITVKNLAGQDVETIDLDDRIFDVKRNDALVHQVFTVLMGNLRSTIAHTKDRSERAGTGKKPWKQKGTGRARAGSVRSPLWRKGGVTHGPTNERNFYREVSQKMRQKAVLIALSEKLRTGKLVVADTLAVANQKTQAFNTALDALAINPRKVVVSLMTAEQSEGRAIRNIPTATVVHNPDLNVLHLLSAEYVLMSKNALMEIDTRFKSWKK